MHQLARLVRRARAAVGADDEDLRIWDRLAHGARALVDFCRRQIGGAKRFREPIHEEHLSPRHGLAQSAQCRTGHRAARIRDVAQMLRDLGRPLQVCELRPQRRHACQAGDSLLDEQCEDVAREQVIDQRGTGADMERRRQLTEPVVEAEGQDGEQSVLGGVLQILGDAVRACHHVPVRQHHAFRLARASGRIEDRHHVGVDDAMPSCTVLAAEQGGPAMDGQRGCRVGSSAAVDQYHMPQIVAATQLFFQVRCTVGRSDQHAYVAVAQDVADLRWLEQRINWHKGAACACGCEHCNDGFELLRQVDGNAIQLFQFQCEQRAGEALEARGQLAIGQARGFVREASRLGGARGRIQRQLEQQLGHDGCRRDSGPAMPAWSADVNRLARPDSRVARKGNASV